MCGLLIVILLIVSTLVIFMPAAIFSYFNIIILYACSIFITIHIFFVLLGIGLSLPLKIHINYSILTLIVLEQNTSLKPYVIILLIFLSYLTFIFHVCIFIDTSLIIFWLFISFYWIHPPYAANAWLFILALVLMFKFFLSLIFFSTEQRCSYAVIHFTFLLSTFSTAVFLFYSSIL